MGLVSLAIVTLHLIGVCVTLCAGALIASRWADKRALRRRHGTVLGPDVSVVEAALQDGNGQLTRQHGE